jgi:hypothetical protein
MTSSGISYHLRDIYSIYRCCWNVARSFNFTFRYIDDVLSLNNSRFGDFVDRIYSTELEIKDTTDIATSVSYIDLHHVERFGDDRKGFEIMTSI